MFINYYRFVMFTSHETSDSFFYYFGEFIGLLSAITSDVLFFLVAPRVLRPKPRFLVGDIACSRFCSFLFILRLLRNNNAIIQEKDSLLNLISSKISYSRVTNYAKIETVSIVYASYSTSVR